MGDTKLTIFVIIVVLIAGAYIFLNKSSVTGQEIGNINEPGVFSSLDVQDMIQTGRLMVNRMAQFVGNSLYIQNPSSPTGSRVWGIVISSSNGQFNLGESREPPSQGSLGTTPFIIMPGASSSSLVINPGRINVRGGLDVAGDINVGGICFKPKTISIPSGRATTPITVLAKC